MDIQYPFTPTDILGGVWLLAVLAYAVSVSMTPLARWLAYRKGIVDRPDALLKPHGRPVAYLGGPVVCAGLLAGLLVGYAGEPRFLYLTLSVAGASVLITFVGLLDDLIVLTPRQKVLGQLAAAAALFLGLVIGGMHASIARMFLSPLRIPVPEWLALAFTGTVTAVIVVAACNATNLLDGLDGLCGGVTGIIALGFMALSLHLACYGRFHAEGIDQFRVVLSLCTLGAVLGFLPYNVPPASIFLGDAGSMLLGFLVATMLLLMGREGTFRWFLAGGIIFGLPVIDTALAVIRRVLAGRSIFAGDRGHLYDQLVDRGMSVRKVVGLFYLLAVLAAGLGVAQAIYLRLRYAIVVDAAVLAVVAAVFVRMRLLHPPPG